jgi:phosphoserine phosphatase RsbX
MNLEDTRVELSVAFAIADGEQVCGDQHVAVSCEVGVLIAAIDGLGHGDAAGEAAQAAAELLRAHVDHPLPELIERAHAALAGTRGAAMTLARIDTTQESVSWLGVGNVEGRLFRIPRDEDALPAAPLSAPLLPGVLGQQIPPLLRPSTLELGPGDTVMLATDGIDPGIGGRTYVRGELSPLAEGLIHRHWRRPDDALVLLARLRADGS